MIFPKTRSLTIIILTSTLLFLYSFGKAATIVDESFEGSGYENTWYENTGSGSYLDTDSSIPGNPPPGSGNQCLKSVSGPTSYNAYAYHNFPNHDVAYGRVYLYVDSLTLANTQSKRIFRFAASDDQKCVFFYLYRNASGQLQISVRFYRNSSGDSEPEFNISLQRWYLFEWYYNTNTAVFTFKIDGAEVWNASLTDTHTPGKIILGFDDPSKARSGVVYFDLIKIVDDGWIGEEINTTSTVPATTTSFPTSSTTTTVISPNTTTTTDIISTTSVAPNTTTTIAQVTTSTISPITTTTTTMPTTDMIVDFMGTPSFGFTPLTVYFTNLSVGDISSYEWDFGDGDTSNNLEPTHVYTSVGNFNVSLLCYSSEGRGKTEYKPDHIVVLAGCPFLNSLETQEDIDILRTLRDHLINNIFGLVVISLYYQNSSEIASILSEDPELQDNLKNLVTENLHFAVDLISGEIISVPNENVDDVIYFLDELKSKGTPGLKDAIKLVVEAIREGYFLYGYNHEE